MNMKLTQWVGEIKTMLSQPKREQHPLAGKTFGVICAMQNEIDLLMEQMIVKSQRTMAGMTFYRGTVSGQKVVLVQCGIGKVNAALCSQILCMRFRVDAIIFTGIAGSLDPDVHVFDIVISSQTVQHDFDLTAWHYAYGEIPETKTVYFPADKPLVRLARQAADSIDLDGAQIYEGTVASGDQFISTEEQRDRIRKLFAPLACEMEGAAVGYAAHVNGVPFVIIRSISDNADENAEVISRDFEATVARHSAAVVVQMLSMISDER